MENETGYAAYLKSAANFLGAQLYGMNFQGCFLHALTHANADHLKVNI
jgi:hypothetical protein